MANETILVSCEKCGKQYKIDPGKLQEKETTFNCTGCQSPITVEKPSAGEPLTPPAAEEGVPQAEAPEPRRAARRAEPAAASPGKKRMMGLRGKMAILFLAIPIVLMAVAGVIYLRQMDKMGVVFRDSSSQIVQRLSGEMLAQASHSVALQVKQFLEDHPFLKKENFNTDSGFKLVAVQKIGMTGYTFLYALPDKEKVWRIWAHVNPDLVGKDMGAMKAQLGDGYADFEKLYKSAEAGRTSRGTYGWTADGERLERFIVATPVEGTEYVVVASMPAEEFARDVVRLQTRTGKVAADTRSAILVILAITLVAIAFIVAFYGARLTSRIRALTEAADRISVGEMETEIHVDAIDEIGDLAEAIGRMQESIKLSIERLRRRRNR